MAWETPFKSQCTPKSRPFQSYVRSTKSGWYLYSLGWASFNVLKSLVADVEGWTALVTNQTLDMLLSLFHSPLIIPSFFRRSIATCPVFIMKWIPCRLRCIPVFDKNSVGILEVLLYITRFSGCLWVTTGLCLKSTLISSASLQILIN